MQATTTDTDVFVTIRLFLYRLGIPPNLCGSRYLASALAESLDDPTLLLSVTKLLYPKLARQFYTSAVCIERSMRHAIGSAWQSGKLKERLSLDSKPCNSLFLALAVDLLRLEINQMKKGL